MSYKLPIRYPPSMDQAKWDRLTFAKIMRLMVLTLDQWEGWIYVRTDPDTHMTIIRFKHNGREIEVPSYPRRTAEDNYALAIQVYMELREC